MLVDSKTQGQLKITLSAVEICDWFGSFSEIRYDSQKARAALGAILLSAMESSDFRLTKDKLYIRVFPTDSGGCDIFFVLGHKKRLHRTECVYIYEFACCEDMLSAFEQIKLQAKDNIPLSIYYRGCNYRVLIDRKNLCPTTVRIMAEYAESAQKSALLKEKTQEHWQKICESTPVSKIILK